MTKAAIKRISRRVMLMGVAGGLSAAALMSAISFPKPAIAQTRTIAAPFARLYEPRTGG